MLPPPLLRAFEVVGSVQASRASVDAGVLDKFQNSEKILSSSLRSLKTTIMSQLCAQLEHKTHLPHEPKDFIEMPNMGRFEALSAERASDSEVCCSNPFPHTQNSKV